MLGVAGSVLLVVAKAFGLYGLALVLFRLMGKRCLGDMEPIDFVIVLVIAEIVGAPLADPDIPIWPAVVAITILALLQLGLARLAMASTRIQTFLEGRPIVLIREGRVLKDNLKRVRVTPGELAERLRERGFIGPQDVRLATFETDGMLSAIPKREAVPLTPRFLGRESSTVLYLEGKPVPGGFRKAGKTEEEVKALLSERGLDPVDTEEIILDPHGRLRVAIRLDASLYGQGYKPGRGGGASSEGRGSPPAKKAPMEGKRGREKKKPEG